ncbi:MULTISPECIES: thiamine pyrophosphate-dependent enzyme [unclassified Brevibacterium]|uniref:thiamine pyrophosphate-dependent enzyme n=1 Tax=unclassified Brevibacterium TaxID=2614124 RepID=UPI0018686056|nr:MULTISPECIES: thiamine pyrophosphate-dependent enzyme [unclassified Brevibacterium]
MKRIEALEVLNELTAELPVVVTCAATSRELASLENRDNHFYVLDSMGLVGSITTGLALAAKDSDLPKVIGIEGDGSLLMNPNVLPTGGFLGPEKLLLIVLDNKVYGSTAGLPTYSSRVDLGAIAEAAGWTVGRAADELQLRTEFDRLLTTSGPTLLHASIEAGNAADIPKLLVDSVVLAHRFQGWLRPRLARGSGTR